MSRLIIFILTLLPSLSIAEELKGEDFCEIAPNFAGTLVFNRVLGNSAGKMIIQSNALTKSSSPELKAFGKYVLDTIDIVYNQYDLTSLTQKNQLENIESDAVSKSLLLCLKDLSDLTFSSSDLARIENFFKADSKPTIRPSVTPPYNLDESVPEAWSVQVSAFSKIDTAFKLIDELNQSGFKSYIRESDGLFRVLVGPSLTQKGATESLESIEASFGLKGRLVRYRP